MSIKDIVVKKLLENGCKHDKHQKNPKYKTKTKAEHCYARSSSTLRETPLTLHIFHTRIETPVGNKENNETIKVAYA